MISRKLSSDKSAGTETGSNEDMSVRTEVEDNFLGSSGQRIKVDSFDPVTKKPGKKCVLQI